MPERTLPPIDNPSGAWQLNLPLAFDSGGSPLGVRATSVYVYDVRDQAAPQVLDGTTENFVVPAAAQAGDVAHIFTFVVDETDGTVLPGGSAPTVYGTNEVQTLTSDRTGGTFALDDGGAPTGALQASNETAANVQTALEGLAGFGAGQVSCTGGPLDVADIVIEFTGTKGETNQALLNVTDSGTGGTAVSISETTAGVAGTSFSGPTAKNVPRAGGDGQSEVHIWNRTLTAADLNKPVDVTVADHGTLNSFVVIMVVYEGANTTPIEASSTTITGSDTGLTWTAVTSTTEGALFLAIEAHAPVAAALIAVGQEKYPNDPAGMSKVAQDASDSIVASIWEAGPAPAGSFTPSAVTWGPTQEYTAFSLAIAPAAPASTIANLEDAINDGSEDTYLELTGADGALFELFEVDTSLLPAGAVVTAVKVQHAQMASKASKLQVLPAAIEGTGPSTAIAPVRATTGGASPEPLGLTQIRTTDEWTHLADGTIWSDYTRLGFTIAKLDDPIGLATHRLYWASLIVAYDEGGPTVDSVTAPASPGDPVTWAYSNAAGRPQSNYEVMLIAGSAQDPTTATVAADPADPAVGEYFHTSGKVSGDKIRSYSLANVPLINATFTVAVRTWALSTAGSEIQGSWTTDDASLGAGPVLGAQSSDPTFDEPTGEVTVPVDVVPAGATRAWIWRSNDSGSTWTLANPDDPLSVTAPGPDSYIDREAPMRSTTLRYQVTFDSGSASSSSSPLAMPGADVSTTITSWYFIDPTGTVATFQPEVDGGQDYMIGHRFNSLTVEAPGRAVVLNSDALPVELQFNVRIRDAAQRAALESYILGGFTFRVTDILGRSWLVRPTQGSVLDMQRWGEVGNLNTLADAHVVPVALKEVTG